MAQPPGLFDLPGDILAEITQSADTGRSSQYIVSITCKYLQEVIPRPAGSLVDLAAHDGNLPVLEWAIDAGHKLTAETAPIAAGSGHLHILKYLVSIGRQWTMKTTTAAVVNGHLNVFEYAYENGYEYDQQSFDIAARNGHLNIIKYGYQHDINVHRDHTYPGLRLNFRHHATIRSICNSAVEFGQLHILDWVAQEIGCPKNLHLTTIMTNRIDSLAWLVKNDPAVDGRQLYGTAVHRNMIDILEWLYTNGVPGSDNVRPSLLHYDRPDIIAWADSKGL